MISTGSVLFFSFILLSLSMVLQGQQVIISGRDTARAGETITFLSKADFFSHAEDTIGQAKINDQGFFSIKAGIKTTRQIYTNLGIFKATIYAVPGSEYMVQLPPYIEKTKVDLMNPYFEETITPLAILNTSQQDLNLLIRMFDDSYNPYYDKFVRNIHDKEKLNELDSVIRQIERPFSNIENEFFNNYVFYKTGLLRLFATQFRVKQISSEYFNNQEVLYHQPAYMELFNQVYDNFFELIGRTEQGKKIYEDINQQQSLSALKVTLKRTGHIEGDRLTETIILKNLHDEFYRDRFSRSALLQILDSISNHSHFKEHVAIANNIRNKITRLLAGYPPPGFSLFDQDSTLVSLDDLKGKYVYLHFCTSSSYACLKEFGKLKYLHEKHEERLTIVSIMLDNSMADMQYFLSKNDYNWYFLHYGNQTSILEKYDIRVFPTYFLIGPGGKLVTSPAPSPSENIEQHLFNVMRNRGNN